MTTGKDLQHKTELKDIAQIIIGAGTLALPVAMSTDTWEIARGLSPRDVTAIACTSIVLIAFFVYAAYFRHRLREHWSDFFRRVLGIYGLTVVVSTFNLLLVNQAPWFTDSALAMSETVLVSLPASFAATIVDHIS